ncbi:MAG: periplasmic oligopeptide-binding protein [Pseudomonadota bacterium]
MTNIAKKTLLTAAIASAMGMMAVGTSFAANVPAGTQLAEKQVLVRNNGSEPQSLDPHKIEGVPEFNLSRDLLEGLVINDPNGKILPGAAESWENKDLKVWTFHIRKGAKWSNGDPVTAQDFVYSWQRLADPKTVSPYASYLQYAHIANI